MTDNAGDQALSATTAASVGRGAVLLDTPRQTPLRSFWLRAKRQPLGLTAFVVLAILVFAGAAAPWIAPHPPFATDYEAVRAGPSWDHLFGTDEIGRDIFSRVLYGIRISLFVGFASVALGTSLGVVVGLFSGYFGGVVDLAIQRVVDIIMAFPSLILALAIISVLGPEQNNVILAIAIVFVPYSARTVRGSVIVTKPNQYVEAAVVVGGGPIRVLVRHILPNVVAPIIVIASVQLANAIIVEASLSFLGFGTQPPDASLGTMLSDATRNTVRVIPWLIYGPGIAIAAIVLSVNLLGDALRDILDPKLSRR